MLTEQLQLKIKEKDKHQIIMTLAKMFESRTDYLFLSPEELVEATGIGTIDAWHDLLNMDETKNYIKAQMSFISQIAQRKTFQSLVQLALNGNQQAAKQVQELSGVLNQVDSNKVVVLHYVPRPNKEVIENES